MVEFVQTHCQGIFGKMATRNAGKLLLCFVEIEPFSAYDYTQMYELCNFMVTCSLTENAIPERVRYKSKKNA